MKNSITKSSEQAPRGEHSREPTKTITSITQIYFLEEKSSACLAPAFCGQCKCPLVRYVVQDSSV